MGNSLGDVFQRSNKGNNDYSDQIAPLGNFTSIDDAEKLHTSKLAVVRSRNIIFQ